MKVFATFLQGDLEEGIHICMYMKQLPCFVKPGGRQLVCRLNKALYGLKQSSWGCLERQVRHRAEESGTHWDYRIESGLVRGSLGWQRADLLQRSSAEERTEGQAQQKDLGSAESDLGISITRTKGSVALDISNPPSIPCCGGSTCKMQWLWQLRWTPPKIYPKKCPQRLRRYGEQEGQNRNTLRSATRSSYRIPM